MAVFWSRPVLVAARAALILAAPLPAAAHHGWSSYDASKVIKAEVPIEAVRYQNPHGEIDVTYEGKRWLAIARCRRATAPNSRSALAHADARIGQGGLDGRRGRHGRGLSQAQWRGGDARRSGSP